MIECLCGSRMAEDHVIRHLDDHEKDELVAMLSTWLLAEAELEATFSKAGNDEGS